ncbi:MAG: endonuclease III domain-containing protein [Desulfovibrio sp.]|jgi:endonuclease-3 related protein|nr:endonuclease III domain-containing protein [Desulfovibrio sp.]
MSRRGDVIRGLYEAFAQALGPSRWWPGETPFEVAVGAILTQNTNWKNVEQAIANLKAAGAMTEKGLRALSPSVLEDLIRPAGYYRVKTKRLTEFLDFLEQESGLDIEALRGESLHDLRPRLLSVRGIGPETADSILCYALDMPTFVVDAYTFRMFARHGLVHEGMDYHELQESITDALPQSVTDYNEFHALIVRASKEWCSKSRPRCAACPARGLLDDPERLPQ